MVGDHMDASHGMKVTLYDSKIVAINMRLKNSEEKPSQSFVDRVSHVKVKRY